MQYDYFIASRWRNRDAVLEIVQKLRGKEKIVYSFFEGEEVKNLASKDPDEVMTEYESTKDWKTDKKIHAIFENDLHALKASDCIVVLLPAGRSAHIEAGIAYGLGKKLILVGEQKEAESLYLIFDAMYDTIDQFIERII